MLLSSYFALLSIFLPMQSSSRGYVILCFRPIMSKLLPRVRAGNPNQPKTGRPVLYGNRRGTLSTLLLKHNMSRRCILGTGSVREHIGE
ncbi:hypothetical protein BDV27DRAFT_133267 [Aspergillus caelatus]|uniref:Secreted protein n=1 Tax=Aspergillus caelatus TaxID=61420 RepID=A0A5N6ZVI0_9EURO|nr:uncharacterized protein BDV27DRAFT_133267 [Aspergillus caelatus]KAE8361283.1 hypothetical protein BDV27DRAFT_133267 [Aspergillus caelatus]